MVDVIAKLIPMETTVRGLNTPHPKVPGEFRFESMDYHASEPPKLGEMGRLDFACPRGEGRCGAIIIGNGFKPLNGPHSWTWDGNVAAPTLTPSINCLTGKTGNPNYPEEVYAGCGWHGFLTAGVFKG